MIPIHGFIYGNTDSGGGGGGPSAGDWKEHVFAAASGVTVYILPQQPRAAEAVLLMHQRLPMRRGIDFTVTGPTLQVITILGAMPQPLTGEDLRAYFQAA